MIKLRIANIAAQLQSKHATLGNGTPGPNHQAYHASLPLASDASRFFASLKRQEETHQFLMNSAFVNHAKSYSHDCRFVSVLLIFVF